MLRSTAALFLNDRTYEGQKEDPIQEIVDFILEGSGVVLAKTGCSTWLGRGYNCRSAPVASKRCAT